MAKTNWALTDTVRPSDLNAIGEEINQNAADLESHKTDPNAHPYYVKADDFAVIVGEVGDKADKTYVDEHLADLSSQAAGKGASLVGIQDAAGLFTSMNAEGALREAMEKANSAFQSASDGKTAVAAAITGKGVQASGSDTFAQLATKINQITTEHVMQPGSTLLYQLVVSEITFNNTNYGSKHTMTVGRAGTYRVSFVLRSVSAPGAYAQIYKNGVAYGTQRYITTTSGVTYTEDLTFAAGDQIDICVKIAGSSGYGGIYNIAVYGDAAPYIRVTI